MKDTDPGGALRVLYVLENLASMEQPAGLPAITARTGLGKASTYRALRALQNRGYVDHLGRSGYRLGSRSIALASLIGPRPALLQRARPVLARLAKLSSGGAAMHLRSGAHRVLVLGVVSHHPVTVDVPVGERAPLTSGCGGTAILAHLPEEEAEEVIAGRPPGEPRPSAALLAKIRVDGFATSFSANHPGLNGIAAPLLDPIDGAPLGSIAIADTEARLPDEALRRLSFALTTATTQLAPRLAKLLGPNASERRRGLDVTIQDYLEPRSGQT